MEDQLSIWSLVFGASFVVQLVMLSLLAASFLSWVVIFQRRRVISGAQKAFKAFAILGRKHRRMPVQTFRPV